jgi:hypothetical protein
MPLEQHVFMTHENFAFVVLALPSDDGQCCPKHVKVVLNIKLLHLMDLDAY